MKRILMMVLRNLYIVPYGWIRLCYRAAHVDKYTEEDMYAFLQWIDLRANRGGNVHIDAHGQENIPDRDGFMFFPNHQGLYDVTGTIGHCAFVAALRAAALKPQQKRSARLFPLR